MKLVTLSVPISLSGLVNQELISIYESAPKTAKSSPTCSFLNMSPCYFKWSKARALNKWSKVIFKI
jgi:hypothetical protein